MTERIPKLEAAKRQLAEAIILFFQRRDTIAIHTLAAASHQILYDLCKKRGIKRSLLKDPPMVRPEKLQKWRKKVAEAENFFKHANRDPYATVEFESNTTSFMILDATQLFQALKSDFFAEAFVFQVYFALANPEMITEAKAIEILSTLKMTGFQVTQFDLFLEVISVLKSQGSAPAAIAYLQRAR